MKKSIIRTSLPIAIALTIGITSAIIYTMKAADPPAESLSGASIDQMSSDASCPWSLSGAMAGRWANGKLKDNLWMHGSFPLNIPITERPDWYINGQYFGQSTPFFKTRLLEGGRSYLRDKATNTIECRFTRYPYAGTSARITFYYDSSKIPAGGYRTFK